LVRTVGENPVGTDADGWDGYIQHEPYKQTNKQTNKQTIQMIYWQRCHKLLPGRGATNSSLAEVPQTPPWLLS